MKSNEKREKAPKDQETLDTQYGKIGIPAVAAALPYRGDTKNPEYAPAECAPVHIDEAA